MKRIFNYLMAGAVALTIFGTQSCGKTCDPGYEGSDCKTLTNAKFYGTYVVKDTSTMGGTTKVYNYTMTVATPTSSPATVNISNFGGFGTGTTIAGTVSNSTSLTLANTTLAGVAISNATGTYTTNNLQFNYTSTDSGSVATSHATGTK